MHLYNTLTHAVEPVEPLTPGQLTMYVCGVTVYDDAHLGHLRAAYTFEVLRRVFRRQGWSVTYVRNLTDVDDKIIEQARAEAPPGGDLTAACRQLTARYTERYHADIAQLGLPPPDVEPKATEHLPQMLQLIKGLVAKDHAYVVGGDVYFRVRSWPAYGRLSHQVVEALRAPLPHAVTGRVVPGESKEDPLDFALWKAAKPQEPSWDSPWGPGRPGWHIECSAMSMTYLGDTLDLHGGGLDLVFPHHENEIAQSEASTGRPFVRHWVHSGLVTVHGQKMAKSVGNVVRWRDVLARHPNPDVLKLCFALTHFRSPLDFTWERMDEAAAAYQRFTALFETVQQLLAQHGRPPGPSEPPEPGDRGAGPFDQALAADLNTPRAVAELFELVRAAHEALERRQFGVAGGIAAMIRALGNSLALFERLGAATVDPDVQRLIEQRDAARRAKNFTESDRLRGEIQKRGFVVEDTAGGPVCRPA